MATGSAYDSDSFYDVNLTETANDPESIFTIPRRYTQLQMIGHGRIGTVVKAYDEFLKESVAIRKVHLHSCSSWKAKLVYRDVLLRSSLKHPNIILLLDVFSPQTKIENFEDIYFVMEFMDADLHIVIESCNLDISHISWFVYQLLCAVNHLHKSEVIHRDLKPFKILLKNDCTLKLLKFGSARKRSIVIGYETFVPCRYYHAPEAICGLPLTEKVDVWAIGCIFAELIQRRVFFQGRDHLDQWKKIIDIVGNPGQDFFALLPRNISRFLQSLSESQPKPIEEMFPDSAFMPSRILIEPELTAEGARDLLYRMLTINPKDRFSVAQCLKHPFVQPWLDEEEVNAPVSPNRYDENIEVEEKSLTEWKTLLFNEIQNFRAEREKDK